MNLGDALRRTASRFAPERLELQIRAAPVVLRMASFMVMTMLFRTANMSLSPWKPIVKNLGKKIYALFLVVVFLLSLLSVSSIPTRREREQGKMDLLNLRRTRGDECPTCHFTISNTCNGKA